MLSGDSILDLWRCIFFWIGDKVVQKMYTITGTLDRKTWLITKASTTWFHTLLQWEPGSYIQKIHPGYYLRRRDLAHWKGVLEPSKTVMYVKYPYRGLHNKHASHTGHLTCNTCYLAQIPRISTWSDLIRSLAGSGRRGLLPFPLSLV